MSSPRLTVAVLALIALATPAAAQTTYNWADGGEPGITPRWLRAANWSGGAAGKTPGVTAAGLATDGAATDIARIAQFFDGTANGLGIDFGLAGGLLSLGAVQHNTGSAGYSGGLAIGNSSTTTAGVLRLNGATVGGVPNVVYADTGFGEGFNYFTNPPSGSPNVAGMSLQLGGPESVFYAGPNALTQVFVPVPIGEASPGAAVTVRGGAGAIFFAANTYTGRTRVFNSFLTVRADSGFGTAPAVPTPGMIVLDPGAGGYALLSTNAASFTLSANRGMAIGPTAGTGDGELEVADVEVPGFQSTVSYAGAITDNGAGSGRLVKSGNGVLVLGGASTYTGGTLHRGGVIRLTDLAALGAAGTVTLSPTGADDVGTPRPATLHVAVPGTFARPLAVSYTGTRMATVGTPDAAAAAETVFSGPLAVASPARLEGGSTAGTRFTGLISGAGSVTVVAPAPNRVVAFDRPGGNTYTGGTTVASGTLLLLGQLGTASGTGTGPVSVTGGTLGGDGKLAGAVAVGPDGRLTAGTALTSRVFSVGGTLAVDGGRYRVRLFGGGSEQSGIVSVAGAVTLTGNPVLELDLNGQTVAGLRAGGTNTYQIVSSGTSVTGAFAPPDFTALGFAPGEWSVATLPNQTVRLTFTPVPEPGLLLAAAAGLLAAGRAGRAIRGHRAS